MGGLKNTDILYKIIILLCSSVKRLGKVDNNSTLFNSKKFGANFKFHSNLYISRCPLKMFPLFYQEISTGSSKYFSSPIIIPSTITFLLLWYNKNIKTNEKCLYFEKFSIKSLHFFGGLFKSTRNLKNFNRCWY